MLSFDKNFNIYNFRYTSLNTYRFLTMHRFDTKNCLDLFKLNGVVLSYVSPAMVDFNGISLLGAFLAIKLFTGQFPYIAKYKLTSTLLKVLIILLFQHP